MDRSRSVILCFILISCVILTHPFSARPVESIDELVLLEDVVKCKNCHKEHGAQWPKSAHSTSVSDLRTLKAFMNYIQFTRESPSYVTPGIALRDNCFTCHAPRVENASENLLENISGLIETAVNDLGSLKGQSALKNLSKISTDCCVCHMVNGMPEGEDEPNMLYGPGWDEHELAHTREHGFDTVGSPYLMSSKMCTRCHNDWLAGAPSIVKKMHKNSQTHYLKADKSGKTCQSCHMRDGDRTIHNMPIYSGTLNFEVEKTADKLGMLMSFMTVISIFLRVASKVYSKRKQRKRTMGYEKYESIEIIPATHAEELYPCEVGAFKEEQENIYSESCTENQKLDVMIP